MAAPAPPFSELTEMSAQVRRMASPAWARISLPPGRGGVGCDESEVELSGAVARRWTNAWVQRAWAERASDDVALLVSTAVANERGNIVAATGTDLGLVSAPGRCHQPPRSPCPAWPHSSSGLPTAVSVRPQKDVRNLYVL